MRYGRAAIAVGLLFILLVSAGCGEKADKQVMKKSELPSGGTLIYGSLQEPNTLNPYYSELVAAAEVAGLIFSPLVTVNEKGEWVADLAQEVPSVQNGGISPDGLTVTYRLRQGVLWHDGVPFTAADVKFTWEMIMNRHSGVVSREGYDKIEAIITPDAHTVMVRFRQPYPAALTLFPAILPQHLLSREEDVSKAAFHRAPVGTGPFKFKEWRIAEAIELEANAGYFRGKPKLDRIVYKIMPDANVLLSQLKAGEVDIAGNISFAQLDQVKAIGTVKTVMTPGVTWEHLDFNLEHILFRDARVRQALALAIDRQAMVAAALKGAAVPSASDQPAFSWAYNPALKPPGRDVNAARELLQQAGWKQGADGVFVKDGQRLSFTLATTSGNRVREAVARLIVQQLREAGAKVELRWVEPATFFADTLKMRRFETALYAWVGGLDPDNSPLWHSKQIPSAFNGYEGRNYAGWRNAEADMLLEQAARSADIEQRRQRYYRLQELLVQECPVIPLYFRAGIDAVKTTVANYKPNPGPAGNVWNAWEWALSVKK